MDKEAQEKIELKFSLNRLWCQHCKAMQKTNNTVVDCWYNPLDEDKRHAFCASSTDAIDGLVILFEQLGYRKIVKV